MVRTLLVLLPMTVLLGGCGSRDPVAEVPGHLRPGNAIGVAEQALGQDGGGNHEGLTIAAHPVISWDMPNVPVMQDGQVDVIYFPPRESLDGEAERDDYYVYVKVAEQSFTRAHARQDALLLNSEDPIARGDLVPASQRLHSQPATADGEPDLPYSQSGKTTTKVSVVQVDPARGTSSVVGTQSLPSSSVPQDLSHANNDEVMRMLNNFSALQRQRQQQVQQEGSPPAGAASAAPASSTVTAPPPPYPTPGATTPVPAAGP